MTTFRTTLTSLVLVALSLGIASSAGAVGYGAFFEYSRSWSDFAGFDVDSNRYGVGFAFDTNVSGDRLFNYRLNIGYERTEGDSFDVSYNGVMVDNIFGFGVLRTPHMRLWVGPSIRIGVNIQEDPFQFFPIVADNEIIDVIAGGGAAIGANIHTGDLGSAAVTLVYQYLYV